MVMYNSHALASCHLLLISYPVSLSAGQLVIDRRRLREAHSAPNSLAARGHVEGGKGASKKALGFPFAPTSRTAFSPSRLLPPIARSRSAGGSGNPGNAHASRTDFGPRAPYL